MQAYYPSSAAHSHLIIPIIPTTSTPAYHPSTAAHTLVTPTSMQAYHPSAGAHTLVTPTSMQAYYPSTAAHSHLGISTIPTAAKPPRSPTAAELIASLQNPENLSDEDLLNATLWAQGTLLKWQDEYLDNDRDIRRATTGLGNKGNKSKARQLQDPKQDKLNRDEAAQDAMTNYETSSKGRKITKTANASLSLPTKKSVTKISKPKAKTPQPPKVAVSSSSKPETTRSGGTKPPKSAITSSAKPEKQSKVSIPKDLLIDMNAPQPAAVVGKRTRQPRKIFDSSPAPAPKAPDSRAAARSMVTKKRARSPENNEDVAAAEPPPPAKKRAATPSNATNARPVGAKSAAVKKEQTLGPARSKGDVMREVWAVRRAEGRNGRHGGTPKPATVAKAKAKEGGR